MQNLNGSLSQTTKIEFNPHTFILLLHVNATFCAVKIKTSTQECTKLSYHIIFINPISLPVLLKTISEFLKTLYLYFD